MAKSHRSIAKKIKLKIKLLCQTIVQHLQHQSLKDSLNKPGHLNYITLIGKPLQACDWVRHVSTNIKEILKLGSEVAYLFILAIGSIQDIYPEQIGTQ